MGMEFIWGGNENILKLVLMALQPCEYTKMLGGVAYELYFNLKNKSGSLLKNYTWISLTLGVYNELEIVYL